MCVSEERPTYWRLSMEGPKQENELEAYDDSVKYCYLLEELHTSRALLRYGFEHLKEVNVSMTMHHVPQQLLASGLERLMKCYIALIYKSRNGSFPNDGYMTMFGHDLAKLLNKICECFYSGTRRRLVQRELEFIETDEVLRECVRILSLFGKKGRYFNLDVVSGVAKDLIDPTEEWKDLEYLVEDPASFSHSAKELFEVHYPRVNARLIKKLERLIRAIALQFTVGDHADPFGMIWDTSATFRGFRKFRDEEFSSEEERRSMELSEETPRTWFRESDQAIMNGEWPTREVAKADFEGEWPFKRAQRIIVERREERFSLVNVNAYPYALDLAAKERYKLPFPHEAGVAELGMSIGPLSELANRLR